MRSAALAIAALLTFLQTGVTAQPRAGLEPIASGLGDTLFLTAPPGDTARLFVVERRGVIRIIEHGQLLPTAFLDLRGGMLVSGNETGLLGLAFHPNYAANGHFYVNYTAQVQGQLTTRISRFVVSGMPNEANPGSETILLAYSQPFSNHNGGMMAFGPDGYLYIASGDGGSSNDPQDNAQNLNSLLGKLLRIDVDGTGQGAYGIPADNPFVGQEGARGEVWDFGLRNPWRFSFDRETGDLWIGDVGQGAMEEINYEAAGGSGGFNYGWREFEANLCNTTAESEEACTALENSVVFPVHAYPRDDGRSVTGGYMYRGALMPSLAGNYFFGDFATARVWSINPFTDPIETLREWTADIQPPEAPLTQLASFGEDAQGELYLVSLTGNVYRLSPLHSADQDGSFSFSLSELLRIIQFFSAGALHCAEGTEDGYAPGPGDQISCAPHQTDYNPANWRLSLSELLRAIQLYNVGRYSPCLGGEDGFC
jgi:glucose/arabinose dehydrogenase